MPRNFISSLIEVGSLSANIACTFSGWGRMPSLVSVYPKYSISYWQELDLAALMRRPAFCSQSSTTYNLVRWPSYVPGVIIKKSSMYVCTYSKVLIRSDIFSWKMSGDPDIPIGSLK